MRYNSGIVFFFHGSLFREISFPPLWGQGARGKVSGMKIALFPIIILHLMHMSKKLVFIKIRQYSGLILVPKIIA
jgi:hypothetical protein